jgi:uncharacterized membrane protein
MDKKTFMTAMKGHLSGMPKDEREDILLEYEVHFSEGKKAGKTEEQICKELGNPLEIAKMYRVNVLIQTAEENVSTNNIMRAILASVGLGLFNLILVLGPFVGVLGVVVGIFAASVALVFSGVVVVLRGLIGPFGAAWIDIPNAWLVDAMVTTPLGIGLFALGILIFIFGVVLGKWIYRLTIKYLRFNLRMITGK